MREEHLRPPSRKVHVRRSTYYARRAVHHQPVSRCVFLSLSLVGVDVRCSTWSESVLRTSRSSLHSGTPWSSAVTFTGMPFLQPKPASLVLVSAVDVAPALGAVWVALAVLASVASVLVLPRLALGLVLLVLLVGIDESLLLVVSASCRRKACRRNARRRDTALLDITNFALLAGSLPSDAVTVVFGLPLAVFRTSRTTGDLMRLVSAGPVPVLCGGRRTR